MPGLNRLGNLRLSKWRDRQEPWTEPNRTSHPDIENRGKLLATDHEYFMEIALQEADLALKHGDVPIGALCVYNNQIVSQRHNEKEMKQDATAHAEILALRDASAKLGRLYLEGVTLYSTLEPCPMCAGSLVLTRCTRVVFGAFDLKGGATSSLYNLCCDPRLNFEVDVVSGILEQNCALKLSTFFSQLRSS